MCMHVCVSLNTKQQRADACPGAGALPLHSEWLSAQFPLPLVSTRRKPVLSFAGDGVVIPLHSHGAALLQLHYGTKDWIMYPPGYVLCGAHIIFAPIVAEGFCEAQHICIQ